MKCKRSILFSFMVIVFLLFISLGCKPDNAATHEMQGEVTVDNYTFTAQPHKVRLNHIPNKIIVCGRNAADTLLAFDLGKRIHTVVLTDSFEIKKYEKLFPLAKIYPAAISQEAVLMIKPDFILGMRRFFDPKAMGDTVFWETSGIAAYIQDASGPIPSLGNFPPCTVGSEENFLLNMGKIFKQEERALYFVKEIEQELTYLSDNKGKPPKVLVVEFMPNIIEVFGRNLLSGDIVARLGGEIISYKAPFVSLEEILTVEADVIFVVYHGGRQEEKAALDKMQEGTLRKLKAVRENRVYPLPYDRIVATGIHTVETIKIIKNGMYPNFSKK